MNGLITATQIQRVFQGGRVIIFCRYLIFYGVPVQETLVMVKKGGYQIFGLVGRDDKNANSSIDHKWTPFSPYR